MKWSIPLLALLIVPLLFNFVPLEILRLKTFDAFVETPEPSGHFVILNITEEDVQNYIETSDKAIKLLETVKKRTGIPFEYSFLNDLQVKVVDNRVQPRKTFTQFSGEMYGIR